MSYYKRFSSLFPALFLIAIFAVALQARFNSLPEWLEQPEKAFYSGEPLLTNADGYYYLSLSQDLLDGTYRPLNELRCVPEHPPRPSPPPLLSWLAATISRVSGLSLNWVALFLPPLLGATIVFPVYVLGRGFNGPLMGYAAAVFSSLATVYVYRSGPGFFDTDCLNVTLVLSIAAFYYYLSEASTVWRKILCFSGALLTSLFFFFWWDQTPDVVLVISGSYLVLTVIFFYRPASDCEKKIVVLIFIVICLALVSIKGFDYPTTVLNKVIGKLSYISKEQLSIFPNIGVSIQEQSHPSFSSIVDSVSNTIYIFIISVSGLIGLIVKRRKKVLFLAVPAAIGMLSFFASRFMMFLSPILALGLAFFLAELWKSPQRFLKWISIPLFLLLAITFHFEATYKLHIWPFANSSDIPPLVELQKKSPKDAVIWSPWSKGYLINYWARRATISDGEFHNGQLNYYLYSPLAQQSQRFAAQFMSFYTRNGISGIKKWQQCTDSSEKESLSALYEILTMTPRAAKLHLASFSFSTDCLFGNNWETWSDFFFSPLERPVYLFLYNRMLGSAYWWHWFGTWDIEQQSGEHARYGFYQQIFFQGEDGITSFWGGINVDLMSGILTRGKEEHAISVVYFRENNIISSKGFDQGKTILFADKDSPTIVWMDKVLWSTVFNDLFVLENYEEKFFSPIYLDRYKSQLWKVNTD